MQVDFDLRLSKVMTFLCLTCLNVHQDFERHFLLWISADQVEDDGQFNLLICCLRTFVDITA